MIFNLPLSPLAIPCLLLLLPLTHTQSTTTTTTINTLLYTLLGNITNKGTTIRFDEGRHLSTWHRVFKDGERGKEEVVTKKETRATAAEKKKEEKKVVSVTKQHDVAMDDQHSITKAKHGIFLTSLQDPWIGRSLRMYGQWSENELVSM